MSLRYDPQLIFERLHAGGVRYVIIGGWAVNAYGHRRFTADVDICPDPDLDNLVRLAELLVVLNARQLGLDDFDCTELPGDPTDPESLAEGCNFRIETDIGILDIMQWISGDGRVLGYPELVDGAIEDAAYGTPVTICSLRALMEMKRAAGRPQDLADLEALEALDVPET